LNADDVFRATFWEGELSSYGSWDAFLAAILATMHFCESSIFFGFTGFRIALFFLAILWG